MEGIRCARAMCGGIAERADDLQLLDDRSGPPVRDDERQCVLVIRAGVNEMAAAQIGKLCFRDIHMKRTNSRLVIGCLLCAFSHSFGPPAAAESGSGRG